MQIRPLSNTDADAWLALRAAMWPDLPHAQLHDELMQIAADENQVAIGAFDGSALIAFVELSLHPHAVGCGTGPVAHLEAWYVNAGYRQAGVGRHLVAAGEGWARAIGCREVASDTWLDNHAGAAAHCALGLTEAERLIHYRKPL
jgi:aminoglycoside 6'-N-acetyltransferase I